MDSPPSPPLDPREPDPDLGGTPLHWIPGEPVATHAITALYLVMTAGGQRCAAVLGEALPLLTDELRAEAQGYVDRAVGHGLRQARVLDHLAAQGLDTGRYVRHVERVLEVLLGERPPARLPVGDREWLRMRLAVVAAAGQSAAVLSDWLLHAARLDRTDPDPVMLDLLRRRGAEEIEHRAVLFDVYQHTGGNRIPRYARRVEGMAITLPVLLWLWTHGTAHLGRSDPGPVGTARWSLRAHHRAVRKGLLPPLHKLAAAVPRYLHRSYHPSQEGSLYTAVHYLTTPPAARGAGGTRRAATP